MGRRPGRRRRRQDRTHPAGAARRGDHQTLRPRRPRPGGGPRGRLPPRRPPPRHDQQGRRPLRRDPAPRGRPRPRRRPRPRPRHHPRRRHPQGHRLRPDSLNARRAAALGDLARTQTALELFTHGHTGTPAPAQDPVRDGLPVAREVVLHAHFTAWTEGDATAHGQTVFGPTGRLEEGQRLILLDQVRSWCADSRTKITIKPVIDLNTRRQRPGTPSRTGSATTSFSATAPASSPGAPAPPGAATSTTSPPTTTTPTPTADPNPDPPSTANLAALCRFHHRLKTHSAWTYRMTSPGVFEWTSPHGHHYRRDTTGTSALDPPGLATGAQAPSSTNDAVDPPQRD